MQSLLVVGSVGSGAGVVAGSLARCGYFLGRDARRPAPGAAAGAYECAAVRAINETLLVDAAPPFPPLPEGRLWLARLPRHARIAPRRDVGEAMRELVAHGAFCLRDPRFAYTLPAWRRYVGDAVTVCVFRDPARSVRTMREACARDAELARLAIDDEHLLALWTDSYRRVLDEHAGEGRWLFVHYEQLFTRAGCERLGAFVGAELDEGFPDPYLSRDAGDERVTDAARAAYAELCARANYDADAEASERTSATAAARGGPDVATIVPVRDADVQHVPRMLADLAAQRGVVHEVVLVDQTIHGLRATTTAAPDGLVVRALRERSPSRGRAFRRALAVTDAPYVAWHEPAARPFPSRLARQAELLAAHPDVDLVTSDLFLADGDDPYAERVAFDPHAAAPPPFWRSGTLLRRDALAAIDETCFVPAELALYRALREAGRTLHQSEAYTWVERAVAEERRADARQDAELLRLAATPHEGPPEVTVLLACHDRSDVIQECLEGFARQCVPRGTFELVVIDDGSTDGTREMVESLVLPVPLRLFTQDNAGACAARNRGLPHARGRLVLFVNDDTIPFPDTVRRHLEAHAELDDERAIVLGTFEQSSEACENALVRMLERTDFVFGYGGFQPDDVLAGVHFYTCNISVPRAAVQALGGFDESFPLYAEDTDYGVRLQALGYRIHFRPEARSIHRHVPRFEGVRWRQRVVALAHVRLFRKHPALLNDGWARMTAESIRGRLDKTGRYLPEFEAAGRTLADVDLARLERLGGDYAELARELEDRLVDVFPRINNLWWLLGFQGGFGELRVSGFPELLASSPFEPAELRTSAALVHCDPAPTPRWTRAAERWLAQRGTPGDAAGADERLVLWADPERGPELETVGKLLAPILRRARRAGRAGVVAVVAPELEETARVRLFASMRAWLPTGSVHDAQDRELADLASTPELVLAEPDFDVPEPRAIAKAAAHRLVVWPGWDDPEELGALVEALAPLLDRRDACLVALHDAETDGDATIGLVALEGSFQDRHGDGATLQVLLTSAPRTTYEWMELALAVDACLCAPTADLDHAERLEELGVARLVNRDGVRRWLAQMDDRTGLDVPVLELAERSHA